MMDIEIDPETNMPKVPSNMHWSVESRDRDLVNGRVVRSVCVEVKLIQTAQTTEAQKWEEEVTEYREVPFLLFWTKQVSETHKVQRTKMVTQEYEYVQAVENMFEMKASTSTKEPGWVDYFGNTRQSDPRYGVRVQRENFWYKPEELTDENVQKAAIRCFKKYWDRCYEEALAEEHVRSSAANRERLMGKYGPKKLDLQTTKGEIA